RALFELLISVSGVGVNTARVILSSFSADELRSAILSENVSAIKSVKGIGLKTAQRMILELKDKITKGEGSATDVLFVSDRNAVLDEAAAALQMLGFAKANVNKVLQSLISSDPSLKVEDLIKKALQML
ncbi:MAG: Holliday junction branch migration protein RuvA, partial [Candidatus Cryptobacteroides sp.]